MNPPKIGDMVSLDVIDEAHLCEVVRKTRSLAEAAAVLKISVSKLFRFRERKKMGRPDRTPPQDDAETWTDD